LYPGGNNEAKEELFRRKEQSSESDEKKHVLKSRPQKPGKKSIFWEAVGVILEGAGSWWGGRGVVGGGQVFVALRGGANFKKHRIF